MYSNRLIAGRGINCCLRRLLANETLGLLKRHCFASKANILNLEERGLFKEIFPPSCPELPQTLGRTPQCMYAGFDPTSDSLHIGHLLVLLSLLHCQRGGHQVIAVVGGATSRLGDPTGKGSSRDAIPDDVIRRNVDGLTATILRIFSNHEKHLNKFNDRLIPVKILDNSTWYNTLGVVEFLAKVGRHCRVGWMMRQTSVQTRLQSEEGLNVAEFMYMTLQAYDWMYLLDKYNCFIQIGGSDQMGNIYAGHKLISRTLDRPVYGITLPLITSESGNKMGKTAGDPVWLDSSRTSAFDLYQFFLRRPDSDVDMFLKLFTLLPLNEIRDIVKSHMEKPHLRRGQKVIAEQVLLLVHGEEGLRSAKRVTDVLYNTSPDAVAALTPTEIGQVFSEATTVELPLEPGTTVADVAMKARCFANEYDARRVIGAGGFHINQMLERQPDHVLVVGQHILPNKISLLRVGKKNFYIVNWVV